MTRIFVSSTCHDLVDLRAELKIQLEDAGLKPVMSDDIDHFDISGRVESIETCLVNVRSSVAFVCILSQRYGPSLKESGYPDISATHLEYREAKKHSLPVYMFVRDRLEAEHGLSKSHRREHGSLSGFQTRWVPRNSHQIFDFLDEHIELERGASSTNWFTTFQSSIDLKERVQQLLAALSSRALLMRLLDSAAIPILAATFARYPSKSTQGVSLRNVSKIPALDVHVEWKTNNKPRSKYCGDLTTDDKTEVHFAEDGAPSPKAFQVVFSTPSGYKLVQDFAVEGNRYKRGAVQLQDRTGIRIA